MNYSMILPATFLAVAVSAGCHDQSNQGSMQDGSSPSSQSAGKPLEGNPGATTNQTSGYSPSDPAGYHPQSDDTKQYHPAPMSTVQPATQP